MIKYIKVTNGIATIFEQNQIKTYDGYESIIRIIAKQHLVDVEAYKKLVKVNVGIKQHIPIYLSKGLVLFIVKSGDSTYYINHSAIKFDTSIKDVMRITFYDMSTADLTIKQEVYRKSELKAKKIIDYIENIQNEYSW